MRVQQLEELEETIQFLSLERTAAPRALGSPAPSPEEALASERARTRQAALRRTWDGRLAGVQRRVDIWQAVLSVRALVLPPDRDAAVRLKFASLCRKQGRARQAERALRALLASPLEPADRFAVRYASIKHAWHVATSDAAREETLRAMSELRLDLVQAERSSAQQLAASPEGGGGSGGAGGASPASVGGVSSGLPASPGGAPGGTSSSLHPNCSFRQQLAAGPGAVEAGRARPGERTLLARVQTRLGLWRWSSAEASDAGLSSPAVADALALLGGGALRSPTWAKAWHHWALFNVAALAHHQQRGAMAAVELESLGGDRHPRRPLSTAGDGGGGDLRRGLSRMRSGRGGSFRSRMSSGNPWGDEGGPALAATPAPGDRTPSPGRGGDGTTEAAHSRPPDSIGEAAGLGAREDPDSPAVVGSLVGGLGCVRSGGGDLGGSGGNLGLDLVGRLSDSQSELDGGSGAALADAARRARIATLRETIADAEARAAECVVSAIRGFFQSIALGQSASPPAGADADASGSTKLSDDASSRLSGPASAAGAAAAARKGNKAPSPKSGARSGAPVREGVTLQDTLRLLTLWFAHGGLPAVDAVLREGFASVQVENWLGVIPQIIARIHTKQTPVKALIGSLLLRIGHRHPQAVVYPLIVAQKSSSAARRASSSGVLDALRRDAGVLVSQAKLVSDELIRVAILWHELWHEALEEASRLYFGEGNAAGMLAVVLPLHEMMTVAGPSGAGGSGGAAGGGPGGGMGAVGTPGAPEAGTSTAATSARRTSSSGQGDGSAATAATSAALGGAPTGKGDDPPPADGTAAGPATASAADPNHGAPPPPTTPPPPPNPNNNGARTPLGAAIAANQVHRGDLPLDRSGKGPVTPMEAAFVAQYGADLGEAHAWCLRYRQSKREADLHQAWDLYYHVFKRLSRQLPGLTALDLSEVSPALARARDLEIAVPGSYAAGTPLVRVRRFGRRLAVISSKQRPRKLVVTGSDGCVYMFLLKGHEDLRQDERVMQLFRLVNSLLGAGSRTAGLGLAIARYAVIPLSPNSGLIGWVPNCDTLHALVREYREARRIPLNVEHRLMLAFAPDYDKLTVVQKVEVFEHALDGTPGDDLRRVLWLKSRTSEVWLGRRTAYTRSLAVMSVVGYLLGLGDRHPSNLMLDRYSGKVLHIDFGDCFEASAHRDKFPERVPFRLTRMLVRAMGLAGIEGEFRATAESTVEVLRANKEPVMAMLEAFVHDPLINWRLLRDTDAADDATPLVTEAGAEAGAAKPAAATAVPEGAAADASAPAPPAPAEAPPAPLPPHPGAPAPVAAAEALNERAMAVMERMSDKLRGTDFGAAEPDDVATQVQRLIDQATSSENLCQAYIGWCPFW